MSNAGKDDSFNGRQFRKYLNAHGLAFENTPSIRARSLIVEKEGLLEHFPYFCTDAGLN